MTPRSLVGMTMGCRKRVVRARCWEAGYTLRRNRFSLTSDQLRALDVTERAECAKIRETYRIGQRLRPCPGCQKCGSSVRRFAPTAGWKSPRKWVIWDGSQLWMIARTWKRKCAIPNLSDYLAAVEDGTWQELFCDGSGVLPARAKKVRR
jgi:hypothetical protein